ncbi:MAG: transketolase C-terminal domain-containing protein [Adlercreutzia sp.]
MRKFLSGNEAFAEGVRLARPQVISAYPITPQTTVVEALASMVEEGSLSAEYLHVESEHTALAAAIGAAATGARTFTATSSQGLLYMAECLTYASGGRFPIVMMNANRALALPWNIYGDQRDSLSLLDHGWIQVYAENNQEAFDLALMAYAVAEDPRVSLPVMVNVDGFALTHTYESVEVPAAAEADAFLPPYRTANKFDFENPVNWLLGRAAASIATTSTGTIATCWPSGRWWKSGGALRQGVGRAYPGMVDAYLCEDADFVLVTLGSAAGLARDVADELRAAGKRAGVLRIRYLRPMPDAALARALVDAVAVGVLEQDISFGGTGTVYANVLASLARAGVARPSANFIGGLGGDDISCEAMRGAFAHLEALAAGEGASGEVVFFGVEEEGGKR